MRSPLAPLTVACLLASAVSLPATASAANAATGSTISTDQDTYIVFIAGDGQANHPKISVEHTDGSTQWAYTVTDVAPIDPGAGCARPDPADPTTVTCLLSTTSDGSASLQFILGDGADQIDFSAADASPSGLGGLAFVHGGPGDDVLAASWVTEYLLGDDGNDTLSGTTHSEGGAGDDTISGTDRGDQLNGGPGNDTISAGAGDDTVYGNSGDDLILGGLGNDDLFGGPGEDTIYGNSGDDHLEGGPGTDVLSGGPGTNTVVQ
jgi:serralysin